MLSTDGNLLKEGSAVRARMISYGTICGELNILVASLGGEKNRINIAPNVFVYPTASKDRISSRLSFLGIGKKIKADMVTSQDPFETGLFAWLISKKIGAKLELQIHTDFLSPYFADESFLNKIRVFLSRFLLPKADSIRVVSKRISDSLKAKSYKLKAIPVVLPVFVDIEKIRKAEPKIDLRKKYPQFDFIILMVSRLTREKNIGLGIEALAEVIKNHPKAGLIIVGSGPEESKLKSQVTDYKLQDKVIFVGWVEDVVSYFKTADAFLNTSKYEGFGMALIEAAASDCPIISTDTGIAGSVLRNGEEAFICPIGDATCFCRGLERLIAYPALCKEIALRAETAIEPLAISKEEYLKRMKEIWDEC